MSFDQNLKFNERDVRMLTDRLNVIDVGKLKSNDLLLRWENHSAISWSKEASYLAEYTLVNATYKTEHNSLNSDCSSTQSKLVYHLLRECDKKLTGL